MPLLWQTLRSCKFSSIFSLHFLNGLLSEKVNCSIKGCDRSWHYPCGAINSCLTRFCDKFESYCSRHVPDPNGGKEHGDANCSVCVKPIGDYNHADSIISSCCLLLDDWDMCFLHKKCVNAYTLSAGYDSMCINCSMEGRMTKEKWQHEMRLKGIFIPMREASWEADGRFKEQVKNKCGSSSCKTLETTKDVWTCFVCGCFPKHLKCANVDTFEEYYCPKCIDQSFVQRVPLPCKS